MLCDTDRGPYQRNYTLSSCGSAPAGRAAPNSFLDPNGTEGPVVEAAARTLENRLRQELDDDAD